MIGGNNYVLEPTQTRLLSLSSFEPHVKFVSLGIITMFLLMTGLWYFGLLPLELYETFLIFAGFSLLFEFLPMLRRRGESKVEAKE